MTIPFYPPPPLLPMQYFRPLVHACTVVIAITISTYYSHNYDSGVVYNNISVSFTGYKPVKTRLSGAAWSNTLMWLMLSALKQ